MTTPPPHHPDCLADSRSARPSATRGWPGLPGEGPGGGAQGGEGQQQAEAEGQQRLRLRQLHERVERGDGGQGGVGRRRGSPDGNEIVCIIFDCKKKMCKSQEEHFLAAAPPLRKQVT